MGTRSTAMGGVGTATVSDAASVFYNPAGLVQIEGSEIIFSTCTIRGRMKYRGADPWPGYGVTEQPLASAPYLPQFYAAKRLGKNVALGIGFTTPFGLAFQWANPETFTGRHIAYHTELQTLIYSPTLSYRINPRLRLGIGLNLVRSYFRLDRYLIEYLPDPVEAGTMSLEGNSTYLDSGWTMGLQADLGRTLRLGLSYKSDIRLHLEGMADFTEFETEENLPVPADGRAKGVLPLPGLYSFGLASEIRENLLLEVNLNLAHWSAYDVIRLEFDDHPEDNLSLEEYWKDALSIRAGLEQRRPSGVILRAGFFFDDTPQPSASCGPLLPDSEQTSLSFGFSTPWRDVVIDYFGLLLFIKDRKVRDNKDSFNGDYRAFGHVWGIGLKYKF